MSSRVFRVFRDFKDSKDLNIRSPLIRSPLIRSPLIRSPLIRSPLSVHPPLVRIGVIGVISYYDMVKQSESHSLACFLQANGQIVVLTAGHGIATWVIMRKDKVGGSCYESMPQNQTDIHGGFRYATTAYHMIPHKLVLYIQQEQVTLLMWNIAYLGTEQIESIRGRAELSLGSLSFKKKALAQFHCRLYGHGLSRTYTIILFQFLSGECTERTKTVAMLTQNFAHKIYAGNLRRAATDENGQEFGIAYRLGTKGHDTLARPFVV